MKPKVRRGEIWLVDLGMARKVRPVLVLSVAFLDEERAVVTFVARTTSSRGTRFEVAHPDRRFKPGIFDAQSISTNPVDDFIRFLAVAPDDVLVEVEDAVRSWLAL